MTPPEHLNGGEIEGGFCSARDVLGAGGHPKEESVACSMQ